MSSYTDWTAFRRELHRHPEVSEQEATTAQRVADRVLAHEPDQLWSAVGGHGLVALYRGAAPGPTVLVRAELDALPIEERFEGERPHASQHPGRSHACGHDGHATLLCGLAERLARERPPRGNVLLLWQPAEENGIGAAAVLADPRWAAEIPEPDEVYALHNIPGSPRGLVLIRPGSFTASVRSLVVHWRGKTSHAAEPEHGINPAPAIAELTLELLGLSQPEMARPDFSVVTPVHVALGEVAYGVSAGEGTARFTIRAWDEPQMNLLVRSAERMVKRLTKKHGLEARTEWVEVFHANQNAPGPTRAVEQAAKAAGLGCTRAAFPFKWGEDFGLFTQRYAGAMFGLGAGEEVPALHNPDYDFPDELLPEGIAVFEALVRERLEHV